MANLPLSCANADDPAGAAFFCFAAVAPPKTKIVAVATIRTSLEFMRINIATLLRYVRIYPRLASLKTRQLCNESLPQTSLLFTCFAGRCTQNDTKALRRAVTAGAWPRLDGLRSAQSGRSRSGRSLLQSPRARRI